MSFRSSRPTARHPRGFTLLEVLCAFAILAALTGMLTVNFVQNVEKGVTALSHRELREAADTIFRKIIYEWEEYDDGSESTLDDIYGEFARLKGWERDRWAIYRYHLEKKEKTVVGVSDDTDESLFDSQNDGSTSSSSSSSSSSSGSDSSADESADALPGIELVRIKLDIYRTDEDAERPLLTLVTWIDPEHGQVKNQPGN